MTQSLFDDQGFYTDEARDLSSETHETLKELFDSYVRNDYSHRDIANIMRKAVEDLEMDYTLGHI